MDSDSSAFVLDFGSKPESDGGDGIGADGADSKEVPESAVSPGESIGNTNPIGSNTSPSLTERKSELQEVGTTKTLFEKLGIVNPLSRVSPTPGQRSPQPDENEVSILSLINDSANNGEGMVSLDELYGSVATTKKKSKQSRPICYECLEEGHSAADCPLKTSRHTCFICGRSGHESADCPYRICYRCGEFGHRADRCSVRSIEPGYEKIFENCRCYHCGGEHHSIFCEASFKAQCRICGGEHRTRTCRVNQRDSLTVCITCGERGHTHHECTTRIRGPPNSLFSDGVNRIHGDKGGLVLPHVATSDWWRFYDIYKLKRNDKEKGYRTRALPPRLNNNRDGRNYNRPSHNDERRNRTDYREVRRDQGSNRGQSRTESRISVTFPNRNQNNINFNRHMQSSDRERRYRDKR